MSVIAGCSHFDGIMLLADCRVTIKKSNNKYIYSDSVQKLFALTENTGLGFVGNINIASYIIGELLHQLKIFRKKENEKLHPVLLHSWLPRFFATCYKRLSSKRVKDNEVNFMVGSIIHGLPNEIERCKVSEILDKAFNGKSPIQRNWLPNILFEVIKTPQNEKTVLIGDCPKGLLYYMKSPDFHPVDVKPLEYCAIGSGESVVCQIDNYFDWIFAGEIGNPYVESFSLREAVNSFIATNKIESVGGLYPIMSISSKGQMWLGQSLHRPKDGATVSLNIEKDGKFILYNDKTNIKIESLYPWDTNIGKIKKDNRFDYLRNGYNFH